MGKCVTGSTLIVDPLSGARRTIREMVEQQAGAVIALDQTWRFARRQPSAFIDNGLKPAFRVRTALGREIEATATHPLLTIKGWRSLGTLKVGERIAVPKKLACFGQTHWSAHKLKALAYFIADGGLTNTSPRFTNVNPAIIEDFTQAVCAFGGIQVRRQDSCGTRASSFEVSVEPSALREAQARWSAQFRAFWEANRQLVRQTVLELGISPVNTSQWKRGAQPSYAMALRLHQVLPSMPMPEAYRTKNPVRTFLEEEGIWGLLAVHKHIPESVFTLRRQDLALFLNRLFSCDGCATVASPKDGSLQPSISYASASKRLASDVQHLLLRFGILAKIRKKQVKYKASRRIAYEVEIHGSEDICTFAKEIGIFGKEAAVHRVAELAASRIGNGWSKDTLPIEIWERFAQEKGSRSWAEVIEAAGWERGKNVHVGKRAPRRGTAMRLAQALGDTETAQIAQADVYWDHIVSIEPLGMQQVYDLTVPGDHNFVANDIIVHNTAFALNIAEHVAVEEKRVVGVFSLEMSKEQLVDRLISSLGRVDSWKLRNGQLSEEDMSNLISAQAQLAEAPLFIDDAPMASVMEVRAKARRLQAEHGLDLLIIDYLQLMQGSARNLDNRVQEVSEISRSLKALAKELSCPVIALSQLSRAVEARNDKRPMLSDLRESGSIEQDADVVMFLYRDDYYNKNKEEHDHIVEVIVSKHRNGPTGDAKLSSQFQYSRFYDIDLRH